MNEKSLEKSPSSYIIRWNGLLFDIDPAVFSRLSRKFSNLLKDNPKEYIIEKNYDYPTIVPFINACQLKSFDVNRTNAFDLLEISKEWEASSLESYVQAFIDQNKLQKSEKPDILGILLEKIELNTDGNSDWKKIADYINSSMKDERFQLLPPEVVFRILSYAELKGLNQRLLIQYIVKVIESNPENAIPLVLHIDFSQLDSSELEIIMGCRRLHEQNLGFFLSSSLTSLANKTNLAITNHEKYHNIQIQSMKTNTENKCREIMSQTKQQLSLEMEEIIDEIERQQIILNELTSQVQEHKIKIAMGDRKVVSKRSMSATSEIQLIMNNINKEFNDFTKEIDDRLIKFDQDMERIKQQAGESATEYFREAARNSEKSFDRTRIQLEDLSERGINLEKQIHQTTALVADIKSLLLSKIIRDKMRQSHFLRRTNNKYQLFSESIWNISPQKVTEAEAQIKDLESQIDKYCPPRQGIKQI